MGLALLALGGLCGAALLPLCLWRRERAALAVGAWGGALSCALGLAASLRLLLSGASFLWTGPWSLPIGSLRLGVDPLSAFFLCLLFAVGLAATVYGQSYTRFWIGRQHVAAVPAGLNALLASVGLVLVARDGIVFLFGWEAMTIAAFLLISFEHRRAEVREGALWYLVFNHLGVACLFGFFALLARALGTSALPAAPVLLAPPVVAALLLLALVGFGTKAGLAPLHIWLPAAHPVAPSHASAVLSAAMLKVGIYGLLRLLLMLRGIPAWWGWVLVLLGAGSALLGAVNLLATSDLKRSLAYSSIENIGVIVLSLGIGALGLAAGAPGVAALGFAGALLHCLAHAVFKSLLFSAAGSVVHATHTRKLDELGGLWRRMPVTAAVFLVGAGAAAAIPGLAGFTGEFVVYLALLEALRQLPPAGQVMSIAALAALALTSGLAAAGLARTCGLAFGGTARSEAAAHAQEQPRGMLAPMLGLAACCALIGLLPRGALALVVPVLLQLGVDPAALTLPIAQATQAGRLALLFLALCGALALLRQRLLSRATVEVTRGPTWGCGFPAPTPRMQYSAPSFASPLLRVFRGALSVPRSARGMVPRAIFPQELAAGYAATDRVESAWLRALGYAGRGLAAIRALHRPQVQQYLVYVFIALVLLLSWSARLVRR